MKKLKRLILSVLLFFFNVSIVIGAQTIPHVVNYQGVMIGSGGAPITTPKTFRFSIWVNSDYLPTDITSGGEINTSNSNYTGYFETQTVTPDSHGNFVTQIGAVIPLPDLDPKRHKYLQVEVKNVGAADTSYELLDVDNDVNNSTDRRLFTSAPYAMNADLLDNGDVGTSSGDLALLSEGGKFHPDRIPNFTNDDTYTINNDDTAGDIKLIFGKILNKVLKWSSALSRFELGDSLFIWGNLAVDKNTYLGNDDGDITTVNGTFNLNGTGFVNGRNLNNYLDKVDTIEWNAKDDQASYEVPFSATGFNATNVKDAILELKSGQNFTDTDDQNASQVPISSISGMTATNVQDALAELKSAGFIDTDDQNASQVPFTPSGGMTSTNVQAAILEAYNHSGGGGGGGGSDDQTATEVPFTPITGISSTNVQDAISAVNNKVLNLNSDTESFSWSFFPGTTSNAINTLNYEKMVPYIMTATGRIVFIGVVTNPNDANADGEFVITKNDNGTYSSSKVMTSITQSKTGIGDTNNSVFDTSPTIGSAGIIFTPGDIIRVYHVGNKDNTSSLTIKVIYD